VLREKAMLWAIVCLVYPVATFAFAAANGGVNWEMLGLAPIVLAGVPIFAVIATALGVFACNPLEQVVQRRIRPSYTYLYTLLAGLYTFALFAATLWQRAGLMVLTALLALALWQKARDHLPYLLDPAASPPARVSLSDGMIAAMIFFVVQGIVGVVFVMSGEKLTGRVLLIAFAIAGATAYAVMRLAFARTHAEGVPRMAGPGWGRALAWGAGVGAAAALAAFVYLQVARHTPLLEGARDTVVVGVEDRLDELWIAILAVVAAPLFEEFHLPRPHLRRAPAHVGAHGFAARQRGDLRDRASAVLGDPGVRPRDCRSARLRAHAHADRAHCGACGLQCGHGRAAVSAGVVTARKAGRVPWPG
jgi:hypothetical protein